MINLKILYFQSEFYYYQHQFTQTGKKNLKKEKKIMENPIDNFWKLKLENVKESLESNNFEVFIADNSVEASKIILEKIIQTIDIKSI